MTGLVYALLFSVPVWTLLLLGLLLDTRFLWAFPFAGIGLALWILATHYTQAEEPRPGYLYERDRERVGL